MIFRWHTSSFSVTFDLLLYQFKCETAYLTKHRTRLINYQYFQLEGLTIGSGSVESGVKQIGRRLKISGAQWDAKNVDQVVKHRCAYLNGQFSTSLPVSQAR